MQSTTTPSSNRFSRGYSEFRTGTTDSETSFLASLNWCGIAAERDCRIVDWSSVRCASCKAEFAVEGGEAMIIGPHDPLPTTKCPECGSEAVPRAFLPDLVLSRKMRIVVEISGKKSSIHDRAKIDFYNRVGVCGVEVTNETASSPDAAKALCQALALSVGTSRPGRVWVSEGSP